MKRLLGSLLLLLSFFSLAGCNRFQSIQKDDNYDSSINDSIDNDNSSNSDNKEEDIKESIYEKRDDLIELFMVGDSTVCAFKDMTYYPRYGYGTQMDNYFDNISMVNLALSGRSSKSFLIEENYSILSGRIGPGDYLMIAFGHNDEKTDSARFTDPTLSKEDSSSFKYHLYEKYIKLATNAGATPILCTPICRANGNNNYSGSSAHITNNGDYAQAIRDLGLETNTAVIDLTLKTKELYIKIGYDNAIKYHAWSNSDPKSADNTHLNIYGAKQVAYMFANEVAKINSSLAQYVKTQTNPPTEEDLIVNPDYKEIA